MLYPDYCTVSRSAAQFSPPNATYKNRKGLSLKVDLRHVSVSSPVDVREDCMRNLWIFRAVALVIFEIVPRLTYASQMVVKRIGFLKAHKA